MRSTNREATAVIGLGGSGSVWRSTIETARSTYFSMLSRSRDACRFAVDQANRLPKPPRPCRETLALHHTANP